MLGRCGTFLCAGGPILIAVVLRESAIPSSKELLAGESLLATEVPRTDSGGAIVSPSPMMSNVAPIVVRLKVPLWWWWLSRISDTGVVVRWRPSRGSGWDITAVRLFTLDAGRDEGVLFVLGVSIKGDATSCLCMLG